MHHPSQEALPRSEHSLFLEHLEHTLQSLPDTLARLMPQLRDGATLAQLRGVPPEEIERMYRTAYDLLEAQSWRDALTVLLNLVALDNQDARFHFAAGLCLQQLGEHLGAAMSFGQAMLLEPADPAHAFRLGEALATIGHRDRAIEVVNAALEMLDARPNDQHALRRAAQALVERLRGAAEGG
jgi:tetratricopeptide (TPR) repeat protein